MSEAIAGADPTAEVHAAASWLSCRAASSIDVALVNCLGCADGWGMGETVVQRWRKYGKDRLYVNADDGTRIGWHDVLTSEDHVEIQDQQDDYRAAVARWRAGGGIAGGTASATESVAEQPVDDTEVVIVIDDAAVVPAVDSASSPAAEPEWEDLAERRAGSMAREQAVALKQAAPVRTFVARVLGVHTDERAWGIGADGEEKVAARLAKLAKKDPRWTFLHAIPVGENGSDIDHLVVGPGGVFTLNSKHHPGARIWIRGNGFRVNGTQVPYVRNSRHEAERASRYLTTACGFPVAVAGIIVPVGADSITIKEPPIDVHVVNRMALADWLRRRPPMLDEAAIAAVFEAARRSTTWRQKS